MKIGLRETEITKVPFIQDCPLVQNRVIPALRQAQDKLTYGQAGIQMME